MRNLLDLTGKVALVTGASSGIGAATAELLAELGARVAIGYHGNEQGAMDVRQRITAANGQALALKADVRQVEEVHGLVDRTARALGPVDILVNNAGSLVKRMLLPQLEEAVWDDIFDVNLKSVAFCTQAVTPSMRARKTGAIVNLGSIAGRNGGGPGAGAYAASKAAIMSLTRSYAKELAPDGIRVNAVAPGVIQTPFHDVFSTPEMLRNFVIQIPMGRTGTPFECATVIAFLSSSAASYLTGETIEINGGQLML